MKLTLKRLAINIASIFIPVAIMLIATVMVAIGLNFLYQIILQGQSPIIYHKTLVISWTVYLGIISFFFTIHFFDQLGKRVGIPRSYKTDGLLTPIIWTIVVVAGITIGPILFILIAIKKEFKWNVVAASFMVALACFGVIINFTNLPPKGGPYLVIVNHSSFLDYFLAIIILAFMGRRFNIVYGTNLHYIPIVGWLLKKHAIPVDREDPESFIPMKTKIEEEIDLGHNVLIFPEAGRILIEEALTMRIRSFTPAFLKIAFDKDIEVLPVVLSWPFLYRAKGGAKRFSPQTIGATFLPPRKIPTRHAKRLIEIAEELRLEMLAILDNTAPVKNFFENSELNVRRVV